MKGDEMKTLGEGQLVRSKEGGIVKNFHSFSFGSLPCRNSA